MRSRYYEEHKSEFLSGELVHAPYAVPGDAGSSGCAEQLKATAEERAPRRYVSIIADQAEIVGVDLRSVEVRWYNKPHS